MTNPPRGRGRPPVDNPRTETIRYRVTPAERDQIAAAAGGADRVNSWARDEALAAADRAERRRRKSSATTP